MIGIFMLFLVITITVLCGVYVVFSSQKKDVKRDKAVFQEALKWNVNESKVNKARNKVRGKTKRSKQKNFEDPTTMD